MDLGMDVVKIKETQIVCKKHRGFKGVISISLEHLETVSLNWVTNGQLLNKTCSVMLCPWIRLLIFVLSSKSRIHFHRNTNKKSIMKAICLCFHLNGNGICSSKKRESFNK